MRRQKILRSISNLTVHRIRLDLTMNQLAERAGLPTPSISRIEVEFESDIDGRHAHLQGVL